MSNNDEKIKPVDELTQLKNGGILILVEEGMPGHCLAYINAIRHSSLNEKHKTSLLHGIASKVVRNMDIFDSFLAKILLRVAVDELTKAVSRMEQISLKDKLRIAIEKCINQIQQNKKTQNPTFISRCIIECWRKLENDHGQTLDEDIQPIE